MRLLRSGLIYTVANLATAGLPFLLLPLLTRALDPAQYGQVVAFALIVTLSGALAGLNVHAAVGVMWFRREPADMRRIVGASLVIAGASTALVAPLVALLLHLFPQVGGGLSPGWGAVAAMTAGATVVLQARLGLWQAQDKPLKLASLQFATASLNLALSLFAVLVMLWGAEGRNGGFAAATCIAALVAVISLSMAGEIDWRFGRSEIGDILRFGTPLTFHILAAAMLSTADRWMVSIKLDAASLGVYGAGAQLGMVMAILGDAFVKAYAPWFYARLRADTGEDRLLATGAAFMVLPTFAVIAAVVGLALYLTAGLVLGPQYAESASVLPWFMLGGTFNGVYLSISSLYFFSHRTALLAAVTMTSGLIGLGSTILLTSLFGMTGAAMGYASAQAILGIVAMGVAIRTFDLPWGRGGEAVGLLYNKIATAVIRHRGRADGVRK